MHLIQVLIVSFALYTLIRTFIRFRKRTISVGELLLWSCFWMAVGIGVMMPDLSQWFAKSLGVGRGADAVFYLSIVGLSYAFFRLYLRSRHLEQQLTLLVRKLALEKRRAEDEQASEVGSNPPQPCPSKAS
jgi:small membrane protein